LFLPRCCLAFLLLLHPGAVLLGNDGAAEVALGGIRLKQERRVAMLKERLCISKKKVRVEYEFRNESQEAVTTEIAFPIPEYHLDLGYGWSPYEDFKVWVDGRELQYATEAHALLGEKEVTGLLNKLGIRVETFGNFQEGEIRADHSETASRSQMDALAHDQLDLLVRSGVIERPGTSVVDRYRPLWSVRKTYHWNQVFRAGVVVRIAHEYTPQIGSAAQFYVEETEKPTEFSYNRMADGGCPPPGLKKAVEEAVQGRIKTHPETMRSRASSAIGRWVRYILTTANTWKTPINDFELIVERDPGEFVTFCWDGPVEKTGANTFRSQMKDFVPSKELTVYFLQP